MADRDLAAGNGSLMRALPTALVRPDAGQRVAEARELSAVTHADRRCIDACVAYCDLAAYLIEGADPLDAVTDVIEHSPIGVDVRQSLAGACLGNRPSDTSGYVLATLELAVWAVCQRRPLEDVLVEIVNMGGDADTTAAVAGGLLGARHGATVIPERWVDRLEYRTRIVDVGPTLARLRVTQDVPEVQR